MVVKSRVALAVLAALFVAWPQAEAEPTPAAVSSSLPASASTSSAPASSATFLDPLANLTSTGNATATDTTAAATASSSAAPVPSGPVCRPYPSNGYCKDYINYSVYTGPLDFTVLEPQLANLTVLSSALGMNNTCVDDFYKYACSALYPKCEDSTTSNNGTTTDLVVLIGCMSTCQTAYDACKAPFTSLNTLAQLPNCTKLNPLLNAPLQPDGKCLVLTKLSTNLTTDPILPNTSVNYLPSCPAPFIRDPVASPRSNATSNAQFCRSGCCVACPQQNTFYKVNYLAYGFTATDIVRAVSSVTAAFIMISYLVLPDKRTHPSTIILMSSVAIFIFSVVVFFPLFDPTKIQCHDAVNPSTQSNNILCAVQGGTLIFGSFATCCWTAALILNMHISIVWSSNFFAKRYFLLNIVCWGIPAAMTAIALLTKSVQYEFGTLCLVSVDMIFQIFFYPLATIIMPAFLLHIATFSYIARISMKQGIESEASRSITGSNHKTSNTVVSHRRHVMNAFKIQWRALLIAVIAITTVVFYWIFYFLQVSKLEKVKKDTVFIDTWVGCILNGGTQDDCADTAAAYLPNYAFMILAETLVSMVGLWLFIVFARRSLWHEWQDWIYEIRQTHLGENVMEKNGEQFFAL